MKYVYNSGNPRNIGLVISTKLAGVEGSHLGKYIIYYVKWLDGSTTEHFSYNNDLRDFEELLKETEKKLNNHKKRLEIFRSKINETT